MSFHAFIVIVESDDVEQAVAHMGDGYVFTSIPWEVLPSNDLHAEQEAGKWIAAGEEDDYYPNAEAEFDVDDVLGQRP